VSKSPLEQNIHEGNNNKILHEPRFKRLATLNPEHANCKEVVSKHLQNTKEHSRGTWNNTRNLTSYAPYTCQYTGDITLHSTVNYMQTTFHQWPIRQNIRHSTKVLQYIQMSLSCLDYPSTWRQFFLIKWNTVTGSHSQTSRSFEKTLHFALYSSPTWN